MEEKFKYFGDLSSSKRELLTEAAETEIKRRRELLDEMSIDMGPAVSTWTRHLHEKYKSEWAGLSDEPVPDIAAYMIPTSLRKETSDLVDNYWDESRGEWSGKNSPFLDAVVVFVEDQKLHSLWPVKTLAHELAHAYGGSRLGYTISEKDGALTAEQEFIQSGQSIERVGRNRAIDFWEEYYAVERELEAGKETSEYFPELAKQENEAIQHLVDIGRLTPQEAMYTSISNFEDGLMVSTIHMPAHQLGSRLISSIENGETIFRQARISQQWELFSRPFDERFGKGSYKVSTYVQSDDQGACDLLETFLNSSDENERENLKNQIIERHQERHNNSDLSEDES